MISDKLPPRPPSALEMMARARFAGCPHYVYPNGVEMKVRWEELTPGAQKSEIAGVRAALLSIRDPSLACRTFLEGKTGVEWIKGWQAMVDEVLK